MTNFRLKKTVTSPLFSKFLLFIALFFTLKTSLKAQTYQLNSGFTSGQTVSTCGGNFYDSGGSGATYSIDENYTVTFCSNSGNAIKLTFSAFDLESGYDFLKIYDGPTTASAARHTGSGFTGTGSPNTITSSGNCLTIQFTSDNSVNNAGFAAAISCVPLPTCTCQKQVLYNTDFEVNTANWTSGIVGGSGTVPITIYGGGPTGNYVGLNYTDSYSAVGDYFLEQRFNSIIAGRTYTFSADLARHSAGARAFMRAEFYNASNVLLSSTADQYATTLFPTFIPFSLELVAPIGATSLRVVGFANSTALKIDNAKLTTCFEPVVQFSNINNTSFCSGGTASLTAILSDPSVSVTYQWQSSTNGTTWSDISGATTSSYTSGALTTSTFFRVKATPSGIGCSTTTSNPVRATILAPPSVNAGADQTVCPNTSVNLAATATNTDIFQIRASHTTDKYLDVPAASMTNGTNITQYALNNGVNQKWRFIPIVGGAPITTVTAGRYYIQNMNSGLYLYPENDGTANNTPVEQGGVIGLTASHQWDLTSLGGGLWKIMSVSSSRSLDIAGGSTANSAALQLYDYAGVSQQKFYIEATAGNNYTYAWDNGLGTGANKSVIPSNTTTYIVTATDSEGCSASDAVVVNINNPIAQITAGANSAICQGQSVSFTAADAGVGATYAWNFGTGATPTTSTSRGPVSVMYATAGSQTTTLSVTVNGCTAMISTPVTVNSTPSVSALSNQTICTGGTAILTASVSGGSGTAGYQWQESTNNSTWGSVVGGSAATTLSYTTAVLTGNKYYRIVVTQSPSTCSATSASALITVVADPTINVTTTAAIVCNGGAVTLNATPNGGTGSCSIQWQSSPTATTSWANIGGATNPTYTPSSLSASVKYRAQITCSGNGCCN